MTHFTLMHMNTTCRENGAACCAGDICGYTCCSALLQSYIDSQEKIPGASEYAINSLRYVQQNAPSYYKQLFSLIVSNLCVDLHVVISVVGWWIQYKDNVNEWNKWVWWLEKVALDGLNMNMLHIEMICCTHRSMEGVRQRGCLRKMWLWWRLWKGFFTDLELSGVIKLRRQIRCMLVQYIFGLSTLQL